MPPQAVKDEEQRQVSTTGFKVLVIDDSNTIRRSAERDLAVGMNAFLVADAAGCSCEVPRRLRGSG